MKIFQIGFSKCATSSFHQRFCMLGLNSVHHTCPHINQPIAERIKNNLDTGLSPIDGLTRYDAFTDMVYLSSTDHIEAFKFYESIIDFIPGSLFILNIRSKNKWIKSCQQHPRLFDRLKQVYGYSDDSEIVAHLLHDWVVHCENVMKTIPKERLLVFDIEKDDARKIDHFLGIQMDLPAELCHANFSPGPIDLFLRKIPDKYKKAVPKEMREKVHSVLRKRR